MQGNQSRQIIPEKANRPVHEGEVVGQKGSTEPGCQSRPRIVVAVQQKVKLSGHDGGCQGIVPYSQNGFRRFRQFGVWC